MSKPDLIEVLAEVNRLRAERDLEPLAEMPKGTAHKACECPVALALGADVSVGDADWGRLDVSESHALPSVLRDFIHAFDRGKYPELVA